MANTTNLNLSKLAGTEKLKSFPSPYNDNMDAIDDAFGSGFGVGNNSSVDDELNGLGNGMAIIANGNTHAAITSGQYVYVRQHGSLSEGLYKATANISANGTLSGSNLTSVSSGGLNDVYSELNSKTAYDWNSFTNYVSSLESGANGILLRFGKMRTISFQGVMRTHTEDEVLATLPEADRPTASAIFANGNVGASSVVIRINTNGQITLYSLNGVTASGRIYFNASYAVG